MDFIHIDSSGLKIRFVMHSGICYIELENTVNMGHDRYTSPQGTLKGSLHFTEETSRNVVTPLAGAGLVTHKAR